MLRILLVSIIIILPLIKNQDFVSNNSVNTQGFSSPVCILPTDLLSRQLINCKWQFTWNLINAHPVRYIISIVFFHSSPRFAFHFPVMTDSPCCYLGPTHTSLWRNSQGWPGSHAYFDHCILLLTFHINVCQFLEPLFLFVNPSLGDTWSHFTYICNNYTIC